MLLSLQALLMGAALAASAAQAVGAGSPLPEAPDEGRVLSRAYEGRCWPVACGAVEEARVAAPVTAAPVMSAPVMSAQPWPTLFAWIDTLARG